MSCMNCNYSKSKELSKTIQYSVPKVLHYTVTPLPKEDKYQIPSTPNQEEDTEDSSILYENLHFESKENPTIQYPWLTTSCYRIKKNFSTKKITILKISNKNSDEKSKVFVISHSLSSNLGLLYPRMVDMSSVFRCTIISYEYTDIEKNENVNVEENLQTDLESVLEFTSQVLKIKYSSIILFSMSMGSIPTIAVASNEEYKEIAGIICISPISSGYYIHHPKAKKVSAINLNYNNEAGEYDCTVQAINIECYVFIIHGKKDTVIPFEQSERLAQKIRKSIPYFPSEATHKNILVDEYREKIYKKITTFLSFISTNCVTSSNDTDDIKINELNLTMNSTSGIYDNNTSTNNARDNNTSIDNEYLQFVPLPPGSFNSATNNNQIIEAENEFDTAQENMII